MVRVTTLLVGIDVGASRVDKDGTLHVDKMAATKALAKAGIRLAKQNNFDIGRAFPVPRTLARAERGSRH